MTSEPDTSAAPDAFDDYRTRNDSRRPIDLRSVVVRYADSPDRRTVFPTEATEVERMTNWISADSADFVDLDDAR